MHSAGIGQGVVNDSGPKDGYGYVTCSDGIEKASSSGGPRQYVENGLTLECYSAMADADIQTETLEGPDFRSLSESRP